MLPVVMVYGGFVAMLVGLVTLLRPIKVVRLTPRARGAVVLLAGVGLALVGMALPAVEMRTTEPQTRLDDVMPNYQFREFHAIRIQESPDRVYRALHQVTAGEIAFFRTLTWLRRFGRPGPESILNAPERMPILKVATRSGFVALADEANREILLGTTVLAPPGPHARPESAEAFRQLRAPGYAVAAMNFRLTPNDSTSTLLTTETRVYATDAESKQRFARYWRVIYPGSALIRRSWLRAVRRRVEKT